MKKEENVMFDRHINCKKCGKKLWSSQETHIYSEPEPDRGPNSYVTVVVCKDCFKKHLKENVDKMMTECNTIDKEK